MKNTLTYLQCLRDRCRARSTDFVVLQDQCGECLVDLLIIGGEKDEDVCEKAPDFSALADQKHQNHK
jgi:hypothetical protein